MRVFAGQSCFFRVSREEDGKKKAGGKGSLLFVLNFGPTRGSSATKETAVRLEGAEREGGLDLLKGSPDWKAGTELSRVDRLLDSCCRAHISARRLPIYFTFSGRGVFSERACSF